MATLLLIDDEPGIQHAIRKAFHPPDFVTLTARTAGEGLGRLASDRPDVILLDVHLPDADGLQAFDRIRQVDGRTPVIMITGHGTTELAIEAMKRGAFDYLLKPLQYDQLRSLIQRACTSSRLMSVPAVVAEEGTFPDQADALIGRCPAIQEVYKAIGRVAATEATVLILGDSGTGKELVARAIYQHSRRADRPFLAINCGALPENLIESELFGHERGAFTGADRKRIGRFEQCNGGTLFLDEIGEMPLLAQVKLLRVLQEQRFERVGGNETVRTDCRVIAATNADLEGLISLGKFRSDLYFRLNVFSIRLPPLRERGDDLDLLVDYYLARFARELDRPCPVLPEESRRLLRRYPWPGNIRELQSVLKQAFLSSSGGVLLPELIVLPRSRFEPPPPVGEARRGNDWEEFIQGLIDSGSHDIYAACLEQMERPLLMKVLQHTQGNQLRAAELLGITRGSLRHKLRALGITVERSISADDGADD
ncbi:MAG: sigma-54 dependent transcriptional regulator [Gemmataceae bacterium]